jgi:hypothetical protein
MAIITDTGQRTSGYIVSEANGYRSRGTGVIAASGADILPGAVLGRVTSGAATATAQDGNTGNATSSAVTTGANVQPGVYKVEFIAATQFLVIAPDGSIVGDGATGSAFSTGGHLTFTITAGATPMVAGDGFNITVAAGSGNYVPYSASATNGAATVAGILYGPTVPDGESELRTITLRDTEVSHAELVYTGTKSVVVAGLAAIGIISRD